MSDSRYGKRHDSHCNRSADDACKRDKDDAADKTGRCAGSLRYQYE
jgi:hypothetical protein